jgi:hypothetical protein
MLGKDARDLRLLFLPTVDDVKAKTVEKGALALPTQYLKEKKSLPQMSLFFVDIFNRI